MRTATLSLSIVVHVIAATALFIAPLLATDTLPEPRSATEFIRVTPLVPPTPPPPRAERHAAVVRPDTAPLEAPAGIQPETPVLVDQPTAKSDGVVALDGDATALIAEPAPPPPPPQPKKEIRVGGDIRPPQKLVDVAPTYPPIARSAGVQGVVILEAVIAEDGTVRDVRVLRSIALLDNAALEAVRQWTFSPTLLNGEPVPVVMTVTVAFRLR